ncbi:hypothetical protein TNIN_191691 [Trichonephila inaurata madagascariensis]|uniref:Uncharacterized protein n=1 Tax=Trichonephila inaurata madagascariensis TaxID=2747483 RepID=A0A8X6KN53_9ARAC|nr:hypothetical protein TNIN_191691 [Trichonephila inaurata madagascariensis]
MPTPPAEPERISPAEPERMPTPPAETTFGKGGSLCFVNEIEVTSSLITRCDKRVPRQFPLPSCQTPGSWKEDPLSVEWTYEKPLPPSLYYKSRSQKPVASFYSRDMEDELAFTLNLALYQEADLERHGAQTLTTWTLLAQAVLDGCFRQKWPDSVFQVPDACPICLGTMHWPEKERTVYAFSHTLPPTTPRREKHLSPLQSTQPFEDTLDTVTSPRKMRE